MEAQKTKMTGYYFLKQQKMLPCLSHCFTHESKNKTECHLRTEQDIAFNSKMLLVGGHFELIIDGLSVFFFLSLCYVLSN